MTKKQKNRLVSVRSKWSGYIHTIADNGGWFFVRRHKR